MQILLPVNKNEDKGRYRYGLNDGPEESMDMTKVSKRKEEK